MKLPVALLPNLQSPGITIITRWPSIAAKKIDETITVPIERQVTDIPDIEQINSVSSEGESRINLIFSHDTQIKTKILEATERIAVIRHNFPREVDEPYIIQYDPSDRPIFIVSFASTSHDLKQLREIIDRTIKVKFEQIEGVSEVFVGGGYEREIQIIVDPDRLIGFGLSQAPIIESVAAGNVFTPGGKLGGSTERSLYTNAKYSSIQEIRNLPVPGKDGEIVHLSQIGEVIDHYRERDTIAKTNNQERVTIYIEKAGNANALAITDQCMDVTEEFNYTGIEKQITYNQGEKISAAIEQLIHSAITGGLVVVLIIFIFIKRLPQTIVISLALPISMAGTFLLMYLTKIELNIMTLSGLSIGAGMLIDNSIVVSESIQSELDSRLTSISNSVVDGTLKVASEVTAATACILVVFFPLLFTSPETQKLYSGLSITVAYSLSVSLLVSLTITPVLIHFVLGYRESPSIAAPPLTTYDFLSIAGHRARNYASALISRRLPDVANGVRKLSSRRQDITYDKVAHWLFRHPYKVMGTITMIILFTPVAFSGLKKEYFNPIESSDIEASIDLETGTDLDETERVVNSITSEISKNPSIAEVSSKIEKWHASLNIKLNERGLRRGQDSTIKELKEISEKFPNAFIFFVSDDDGIGNELNVEFFGDDLDTLKEFATDVSSKIKAEVPETEQVILRFREPKGEIWIEPSRTAIARSNATVAQIGSIIRNMLTGSIITKFYDSDREVDVRYHADTKRYDSLEELKSMIIPLGDTNIPLKAVASMSESTGETKIWRKNKRKTVTITVRTQGASIDKVADKIEVMLQKIPFPHDTTYGFGDELQRLKKSQGQMLISIALSVIILFMLLAALFESFSRPLLILLPVPLAVCMLVITFYIVHSSLSMGTYIGMIMLAGIASNNSILLVGSIFRRIGDLSSVSNSHLSRIIIESASSRIRPILMTTLTTALGMAPLAFDFSESAGLWRPLAITVSIGLLFALTVSLGIVPFAVFHYILKFNRIRENP